MRPCKAVRFSLLIWRFRLTYPPEPTIISPVHKHAGILHRGEAQTLDRHKGQRKFHPGKATQK